MTTIRLDFLAPSGIADECNWSNINIDSETYDNLLTYPEIGDLSKFSIKQTTFSDNVRDKSKYNVSQYPAIELSGYSNDHSLFIVWVEPEKVWITFECEDYFKGDYGPVSCKCLKVEKIYKISDSMQALVKEFFPEIS